MAISKNARIGRQSQTEETTFALKKHNYSTGAGWCSKRDVKGTRGSHTAGNIKSETCQASAFSRHMAKCSRSYKHRDYMSWLAKTWKVGYSGMSFEEYKETYHEAN